MFDIKNTKKSPPVVIRAATGNELSTYEKRKLASIEENAQENKIELVSLNIGGQKQRLNAVNKEVEISLGSLASKSSVSPADISLKEAFYIKCELEDDMFIAQN